MIVLYYDGKEWCWNEIKIKNKNKNKNENKNKYRHCAVL